MYWSLWCVASDIRKYDQYADSETSSHIPTEAGRPIQEIGGDG